MKKVLIITYYWPPTGGSGVQRWLKFAKYFKELGWEPIVYTPSNPEAPVIDESLVKDVPPDITIIKRPIWEPYQLYKKIVGKKKDAKVNNAFVSDDGNQGILEKISIWIRGNFFIPDARMFWIKPSIKYLTEYVKNNKIDVLVSTGPPHSMHMIALGVKEKTGIKWVADFRDPWTNIDFYHQLMLTKYADARHRKLEKKVLNNVDKVVTVSWSWADDFKKICNRANPIEVITNGFDEDDFNIEDKDPLHGFVFHHIGAMNSDRNPHTFWEVLKEICKEYKGFKNDLKIRFTGKTDVSVFNSIKKNDLSEYVEKTDYIPHSEIIKILCKSPILLLPLNDTPNVLGIIPGKLFEYLASRRPIFAIGPTNGDSSKIIRETNAGVIVDFKDRELMKKEILKFYNLYKQGELSKPNTNDMLQYSRKNIAKNFVKILNGI